jgi:hypothetical protein
VVPSISYILVLPHYRAFNPIKTIIIFCLVVVVVRYWWQVNRGRWRRWRKQTKGRLPRPWHLKSWYSVAKRGKNQSRGKSPFFAATSLKSVISSMM